MSCGRRGGGRAWSATRVEAPAERIRRSARICDRLAVGAACGRWLRGEPAFHQGRAPLCAGFPAGRWAFDPTRTPDIPAAASPAAGRAAAAGGGVPLGWPGRPGAGAGCRLCDSLDTRAIEWAGAGRAHTHGPTRAPGRKRLRIFALRRWARPRVAGRGGGG
jgi:hypothetical protein